MKQKQRGVTFLGVAFIGAIVAVVAVVAAQVAPTVMEYQAIMKAAQRAAESGSTVQEIRNAFDKSKAADYFEAVSGRDLEISKENDKIVVEFAYNKEIHLLDKTVQRYRPRPHRRFLSGLHRMVCQHHGTVFARVSMQKNGDGIRFHQVKLRLGRPRTLPCRHANDANLVVPCQLGIIRVALGA